VSVTVAVSLAVLANVHLRTTVPQTEVQLVRVSTGLEARLTRQLSTLGIGSLVRLHGRAFSTEVGVIIVLDIAGSLNELQSKTAVNVPRNVTMHEPSTRIIGLETNDSVSSRETRTSRALKDDGITAGRVVKVESADHVTCESTSASAQDGDVVTVDVQGVRSKELVLNDKVHPLVGLVENDAVADKAV